MDPEFSDERGVGGNVSLVVTKLGVRDELASVTLFSVFSVFSSSKESTKASKRDTRSLRFFRWSTTTSGSAFS